MKDKDVLLKLQEEAEKLVKKYDYKNVDKTVKKIMKNHKKEEITYALVMLGQDPINDALAKTSVKMALNIANLYRVSKEETRWWIAFSIVSFIVNIVLLFI